LPKVRHRDAQPVEKLIAGGGVHIGLRHVDEIAERLEALKADAAEPAIGVGEIEVLDTILGLNETALSALECLRDIALAMPQIGAAVTTTERRLDALDARGIDVGALQFEASHGRTSLEYYDGFVFGFADPSRPELPPVATGGRYDALTRVLGQGKGKGNDSNYSIPAVGGVIRPELVALLKGGR
ncbi:MAG: ATP phosphoribosyltransferase regulatory subunit, partial [Halocynthiibacter sp.]